ncbi:sigma-70 family RNA polymerase sigma factor [Synergistaceae bacterium OttesenSCG-928-D05]|nr:sigma-70 family RNA polymerase sigma factor [Synergistaceae bacterium OttesenSCG-928-D05]
MTEKHEEFICGTETESFDLGGFDQTDADVRAIDTAEAEMENALSHVIEEIRAGKGGKTLRAFLPIVLKYASKDAKKHGISFEDLFQAGCLAVLETEQRYDDAKWEPRWMKQRVPQEIERAVKKHSSCGEVELSEEYISRMQHNTLQWIRGMEVEDMLRSAVSDGELEVADAFLKGYTQTEIANLLSISQQAVAKRLANIRKKTRPLLLRGEQQSLGQ